MHIRARVMVVCASGIAAAYACGGGSPTTPTPPPQPPAPPPPANSAPIIDSIAVQGSRQNQPAGFADVNEEVEVTAVVRDQESPLDQLQYLWTSEGGGTFTGTGAKVMWRAPAGVPSGGSATLRLEVVERYGTPPLENRVAATASVRVHDSARELSDLGREFLTEFSDSSIPASVTIRHFSDSCAGKAAELDDVTRNRENYIITSHTLGQPVVAISFGGVCSFRARRADACVAIPVQWRSTVRQTGALEITTGTSYLTAVYEVSRWWLCDSEFDGTSTSGLRFIR